MNKQKEKADNKSTLDQQQRNQGKDKHSLTSTKLQKMMHQITQLLLLQNKSIRKGKERTYKLHFE